MPSPRPDERADAAARNKENVAALRRVFELHDTDGSGSLSVAELSAIMGADDDAAASALMVAADTTRTGKLDFQAFADLVAPSDFFCQSRATFDVLDANGDGWVTRDEVEQWLMRQLSEAEAQTRACLLTGRWATEGGAYRGKAADEPVSFPDFFLFVSLSSRSLPLLHALGGTGGIASLGLPAQGTETVGELAGFKVNFGDVWGRYGVGVYETPGAQHRPVGQAPQLPPTTGDSGRPELRDGGSGSGSPAPSQTVSSHGHMQVLRHMAAGAIAGTAAKTVIAPADRVKIIFQVSERPFSLRAAMRFGLDIVKTEGVAKLWKGNGAMVARVVPYAGIHFAAHEALNASLAPRPGAPLPVARKFASGAAAGALSTVCTYPLDLLRARLAVEKGTASFRGMVARAVTEGGPTALFRGVGPTLTGIVPYSGTAWLVKESVGENLPLLTGHSLSTSERVFCGISGGLTGQLLTYPLDVTRRRMQVHGGSSMVAVLRECYTVEGARGLFKGFTLNCIKGPIAAGISFTAFDLLKGVL